MFRTAVKRLPIRQYFAEGRSDALLAQLVRRGGTVSCQKRSQIRTLHFSSIFGSNVPWWHNPDTIWTLQETARSATEPQHTKALIEKVLVLEKDSLETESSMVQAQNRQIRQNVILDVVRSAVAVKEVNSPDLQQLLQLLDLDAVLSDSLDPKLAMVLLEHHVYFSDEPIRKELVDMAYASLKSSNNPATLLSNLNRLVSLLGDARFQCNENTEVAILQMYTECLSELGGLSKNHQRLEEAFRHMRQLFDSKKQDLTQSVFRMLISEHDYRTAFFQILLAAQCNPEASIEMWKELKEQCSDVCDFDTLTLLERTSSVDPEWTVKELQNFMSIQTSLDNQAILNERLFKSIVNGLAKVHAYDFLMSLTRQIMEIRVIGPEQLYFCDNLLIHILKICATHSGMFEKCVTTIISKSETHGCSLPVYLEMLRGLLNERDDKVFQRLGTPILHDIKTLCVANPKHLKDLVVTALPRVPLHAFLTDLLENLNESGKSAVHIIGDLLAARLSTNDTTAEPAKAAGAAVAAAWLQEMDEFAREIAAFEHYCHEQASIENTMHNSSEWFDTMGRDMDCINSMLVESAGLSDYACQILESCNSKLSSSFSIHNAKLQINMLRYVLRVQGVTRATELYCTLPQKVRESLRTDFLGALILTDSVNTYEEAVHIGRAAGLYESANQDLEWAVLLLCKSSVSKENLEHTQKVIHNLIARGFVPTEEIICTLLKQHRKLRLFAGVPRLISVAATYHIPLDIAASKTGLSALNHRSINLGIKECMNMLKFIIQNVKQNYPLCLDEAFYSQALSTCARCTSRAYGYSADKELKTFQGKDAVLALCHDADKVASECVADIERSKFLKMNLNMCQSILSISQNLGAVRSAKFIWNFMKENDISPSLKEYKRMINALGHGGDLDSMQSIFQELLADETQSELVDIDVISSLIYHLGRHKDRDGVDDVYDKMLALGMRPNENLNRILIEVCGVDPLSVVWQA
eukprot:m.13954 g.13954  ORF g.13954 m.13954 type:complete len:981 (-) comp4957_c0_seq1:92-3034(-)